MSNSKKGWGTLFLDGIQTRKAHYFGEDGRSLCGRYLALADPRWEKNQEDGETWSRDSGTCQTCWFRKKNADHRSARAKT